MTFLMWRPLQMMSGCINSMVVYLWLQHGIHSQLVATMSFMNNKWMVDIVLTTLLRGMSGRYYKKQQLHSSNIIKVHGRPLPREFVHNFIHIIHFWGHNNAVFGRGFRALSQTKWEVHSWCLWVHSSQYKRIDTAFVVSWGNVWFLTLTIRPSSFLYSFSLSSNVWWIFYSVLNVRTHCGKSLQSSVTLVESAPW